MAKQPNAEKEDIGEEEGCKMMLSNSRGLPTGSFHLYNNNRAHSKMTEQFCH